MFSFIWHTQKAYVVPFFKSEFEVRYALPLLWIEHCVECAAPLCYSTCILFKPRTDGRCLRFENGVSPFSEGGPKYKQNCQKGLIVSQ